MLLFHVNGKGRAYCPLYHCNPIINEIDDVANLQCNTQCAWAIPHYKSNGDTDYFTCAMNDREECAMKVASE